MFCKSCGASISEGDKFCQKCGTTIGGPQPPAATPVQSTPPKPKKKRKGCLIAVIVVACVIFLIIIIAIAASSGGDKSSNVTPTSKTSAISAIEVTAVELYSAYEANEVAADLKYKDKILRVTGVVTDISTDPFGYPTVSFGMDAYNINKVEATFNKSEASNIANLQKGQNITVNGAGNGKSFYVRLKNCTIVK
jgi:flagellar basal body-associated protein FliL